MILKVFSILDKATEAFNTPFFMLTNAEAIRAFQRMACEETNQMHHNPLDFHLYKIAEYDNSTATMTNDLHDLGSAQLFKEASNLAEFPSKEVKKS